MWRGAALGLALAACQPGGDGSFAPSGDLPGSTPLPASGGSPSLPVQPVGVRPVDCSTVAPGAAESRLLTRLQYDNTVRDLLGDETAPAQGFPPENTLLGFGNNADAHRASLLLSERQLAAAEAIAARAVARGLDALLPCEAGDRTEACAARFVTQLGYRAYRRPLLAEEAEPLLELFRSASAEWGFDKGIELTLQAMLQAPQMLYRTESLADWNAGRVEGGAVLLDSYQVASRLSYFLWNTMPDDELFALADAGELTRAETVRAQAYRMLDDPRARQTVADFHRQWLGMERFAGLTRDVPGAEGGAPSASWQRSLEQFVIHVFWESSGDLGALMESPSVFVDEALAPLYGVEPGVYEDPNRAGILTQPGLLSLLAHSDQSAPVQRGKFVREQLLCQQLPPPPPDVDTTPPDPDPNATTRERFRQHSADARCASCHRLLDNVGFGLEGFDHLGRFRAEENGMPIDATGSLLDTGDPAIEGGFDGALELTARLAGSPQVEACLATQWFRYTMGRAEQDADACSLEEVKAAFASSGGSFRELLVALATSDVFRFRPMAEQDL